MHRNIAVILSLKNNFEQETFPNVKSVNSPFNNTISVFYFVLLIAYFLPRTLIKLSGKLVKASRERSGTVPNAWHFVANDFEQTADLHKTVATAILDEIGKPLKV